MTEEKRRCCLASAFPPHHHSLDCSLRRGGPAKTETCTDHTPSWFVGHWRDWHRGHGCDKDDGQPRSDAAKTEIDQHTSNAGTGFLTDAELHFLRTSITSGNTLLCRALDELAARRHVDVLDEKDKRR
jgi:hypothetical protein